MRPRPAPIRAAVETLEGRALLTITPAHVALAERSVAETTPDNNLYTNGAYTVNWAGLNGKTTTVTKADCTTYVTALLKEAYNFSNSDFIDMFGVSSPSLTTYYNDAVADGSLDGFKQIADLKIGDFFVSKYPEGSSARGHMVMIDGLPQQVSTTRVGVRAYNVTIIDVTGAPHSLDTRDNANADGTDDSGVGRANIRLYTDLDGNISFWAWGTSSGSTTYDPVEKPCIFFKVPALYPLSPATLTATAAGETSVNLAWTDRSGIEDGYLVERSSDNGLTYSVVGDAPSNGEAFTDTSAAPGGYTYRVSAVAGASRSGYVTASVTLTAVVPVAPTAFKATLPSGTTVRLTWADNAMNETGYVIERSVDGGSFAALASPLANATTYSDTDAAIGHRYAYRLQAITAYAESSTAEISVNRAVRRVTPVTRVTKPAAKPAAVKAPLRRTVSADVLGL